MTAQSIAHIMTKDYPTLAPDMPIRRAAALLAETGSSAAPVLAEDGRLIGILSQKDCFRPALSASYYREWKGSVGDYMNREVVAVDVNDELVAVANMFLELRHRVFPAVEQDRVVGLVRRSSVLKLLLTLG